METRLENLFNLQVIETVLNIIRVLYYCYESHRKCKFNQFSTSSMDTCFALSYFGI